VIANLEEAGEDAGSVCRKGCAGRQIRQQSGDDKTARQPVIAFVAGSVCLCEFPVEIGQ
jgi:hypothetical protein